MNTLIFITAVFLFAFIIRYNLEKCKNHSIHIKVNEIGEIDVFDSSLDHIATISKDMIITQYRELSFFKMSKIKSISNHFESYFIELNNKESIRI